MNLNTYKGHALRTMKPHDTEAMAKLDWCLGLAGETGEVMELIINNEEDKMKWAKELGDILWYSIALMDALHEEFPHDIFEQVQVYVDNFYHCASCLVDEAPVQSAMNGLVVSIGMIHEKMKHHIMHKEELNLHIVMTELSNVVFYIAKIAKLQGFTIYSVAELNAAKLAHRYNMKNGGVYTHAASAVRHASETKFEDTATYKRLFSTITGSSVTIKEDDVEVL